MKDKKYKINSCRICPSVGAIIAFKGIEGCIPLIHGSQGCATYVRRYLISHFREPIDIASSSFTEENAVFGGEEQLNKAIHNMFYQYNPQVIGITSSCLVETLGEDVDSIIKKILSKTNKLPPIVYTHAPSYIMTIEDAFVEAICATVKNLTEFSSILQKINIIISSLISPADIREIKELTKEFCEEFTLFPDFSDTLDAGHNGIYQPFPEGGTPLKNIRAMSNANATIEIGSQNKDCSVGKFLKEKYNVQLFSIPLPCGIRLTDMFISKLELISGKKANKKIMSQRARLVDAYIDGHKYTYGKKIAIIGEPSFIASIASFAVEIGMIIKIVASGSSEESLRKQLDAAQITLPSECIILADSDFEELSETSEECDIIIGNSKCYRFSKKIGAPLIRCDFPIHDRFGAQRIKYLLYEGTTYLLDRCINAILSKKQIIDNRDYSYM
ncbi:MAG: hypothetical protein N2053_00825 [Chitinispirillaceae bacterium]|nr:hypothetical protein [Chitinispirillaceae bacterium]